LTHTVRITALVAVMTAVLTACGSRVVPLSQGGLNPAGVPTGASTLPAGLDAATADPGTLAGAAGTATRASRPGAGPGSAAAQCHGGATDTGVTAKTVKIGMIASLTGPLPGQFNSAVEAVDSHVRMINDAGGICGRKFELLIKDDNGSGATNQAVATKLATEDKVFAFVGSVSAPDDSGIARISKKHKIPDIGFPLTWERTESPYTYGVPGQVMRRYISTHTSGTDYLNKKFGIKQAALFWLKESQISILTAWAFESAIEKSTNGSVKICHEQPAGVLDNNLTNYVVAMQGHCPASNGPLAVYSIMENNANVKLAIAMQEQGVKPKVFGLTFSSYLPAFIEQGGSAAEGTYLAMPQLPFERLERPKKEWTPGSYEVKRYLDTLKRYYPRPSTLGSFGGPGWGMASLFFEGVRACGADLTRACFFKALNSMGPFSANGLLSPVTPRTRNIFSAQLLMQVRNGRFVEVEPYDKSGPREGPDFWEWSPLFNWQRYFCDHQSQFPNAEDKKALVDEC